MVYDFYCFLSVLVKFFQIVDFFCVVLDKFLCGFGQVRYPYLCGFGQEKILSELKIIGLIGLNRYKRIYAYISFFI